MKKSAHQQNKGLCLVSDTHGGILSVKIENGVMFSCSLSMVCSAVFAQPCIVLHLGKRGTIVPKISLPKQLNDCKAF